MRHQCDQGCLPQQGTFTTHIRPGKNDDLLIGFIQCKIIAEYNFHQRADFFQSPDDGLLLSSILHQYADVGFLY